ncbi:unnamed protein product [Neospora caninum Liverpool]|uniref:Uncharacterized protein n=1 Tax=Neospora caninum (strain Liverpool) TaxID=572307 RepID=F0VMN9_NEOCL|nr:uncharacterized protein NCLIV_054120 [Neospora caninum Liverpool]CBZ54985.1 unnamed protein product [Neospora caninum Liverpool]|eukprot:XP_003885013.1 uncharacterized protein NCLIV_054120 [Neospora caninum Liverpool]
MAPSRAAPSGAIALGLAKRSTLWTKGLKPTFLCLIFSCLIAFLGLPSAFWTFEAGVDALSVSTRASVHKDVAEISANQSDQERSSVEQPSESDAQQSVSSADLAAPEKKDDLPDKKQSPSETPEAKPEKVKAPSVSSPPSSPTPSPDTAPAATPSTTTDKSPDTSKKLNKPARSKKKDVRAVDGSLAEAVIDQLDSIKSVQVSGALLRRIWKEHQRVGEDMRDLLREYLLALERELYTQQAEIFGLEKLKMDEVIRHEHYPEARQREVELEMQALAEQHKFMKKLFSRMHANTETKSTAALVNRIEELDKPVDIVDATDKGSGADVLHGLKVVGKDIKTMRESVKKFSRELETLERLYSEQPSGEHDEIRKTLGAVMDPLAGPVSSMDYQSLSWIPKKGKVLGYVDKAYHKSMEHDDDAFLDEDDDMDVDEDHYDPFDPHDPWDVDGDGDDDDDESSETPRKKGKHGRPGKKSHLGKEKSFWKHDFGLPWEKDKSHRRHKGSSSKSSGHHSRSQSVSFYASPAEPVEEHEEDSAVSHDDSSVFPGLFFLELGSKRTVGTAADNAIDAKQRSFVQRSQHSVQIREHRATDDQDRFMNGEQPLSFLQTRGASEEAGGSEEVGSASANQQYDGEGQGSAEDGIEDESDKAGETKAEGAHGAAGKGVQQAADTEEPSSEREEENGGHDHPHESESGVGPDEKGGHDHPHESESGVGPDEKGGHDHPHESESGVGPDEKGGHDHPHESESGVGPDEKGGHDHPHESESGVGPDEKGGHDHPHESESGVGPDEKGGHDHPHESESGVGPDEKGGNESEASHTSGSKDHPRCIDILDPQKCVETTNCFHDDVYRQCFFNCTSVSLTRQSFEGIMRGCEEFRDKPSCDMMERATARLKESGTPVIYDCHWLSEGPEVSDTTPSDSKQPGDKEEKEVGKEEAAQTNGGRSVCVNRLEAPTAEKLLWGTIIAEKQRRLEELEISRNLTPDKVCVRPRELANATLHPDKPFYALGDQVKCRPGSSFMGVRRVITCHEEGIFDPQVACIPKGTLSNQQQAFMKEVEDYAEVVEAEPGWAAAGAETGSSSITASMQGIANAAHALIAVSTILTTL